MSSRPLVQAAQLNRGALGGRRVRDPIPYLRRTSRPPYRRTGLMILAYGFLVMALALFLVRVSALWWVGALVIGLSCAIGELLIQVRRFKASA
jgi:hypothetical protein